MYQSMLSRQNPATHTMLLSINHEEINLVHCWHSNYGSCRKLGRKHRLATHSCYRSTAIPRSMIWKSKVYDVRLTLLAIKNGTQHSTTSRPSVNSCLYLLRGLDGLHTSSLPFSLNLTSGVLHSDHILMFALCSRQQVCQEAGPESS